MTSSSAIGDPTYEVPWSRLRHLNEVSTLFADLDRCPHGRHEGDACTGWTGPLNFDGGCRGGVSLGNPHITVGDVIGYDIGGRPYVMPPRGKRHDPANWKTR